MYFTDTSFENDDSLTVVDENTHENHVMPSEAMEESSWHTKDQMEPSTRSPMAQRSPAWSYFTKQNIEPNQAWRAKANCNLCGAEVPIANFGTTGLFTHLRRHHAQEVQIEALPRNSYIPVNKGPPVVKRSKRTNASPVWKHFTRPEEPGKPAVCTECGLEVAVPSGSTTGMFAHLRKYHPVFYRQAKFKNLSISGAVHDSAPKEPLTLNLDFPLPERFRNLPCEVKQDLDAINNDDMTETILVKSSLAEPPGSLILERLKLSYVTQEYTDLVFHCDGGTVSSHKIVMAGLSQHLKNLFLLSDQEEVDVYLPHVKLSQMEEFLINVYGGQQTPMEVFREVLDILMIFKPCESLVYGRSQLKVSNVQGSIPATFVKNEPLVTHVDTESDNAIIFNISPIEDHNAIDDENNEPDVNDYPDDIEEPNEYPGDNEEPSVIDDPEWFPNAMPPKNSHSVIEMPNMQQLENQQKTVPQRSKKSSLIWNYFDKTCELITCRLCGVNLKNVGNTTNAAHHLKKHPTEYINFKNDSLAQKLERDSNKLKEDNGNVQNLTLQQSPIWEHFISFNCDEGLQGKCKYCSQKIDIFDDNYSALIAHLKAYHPNEGEKYVTLKTGQGSLEWVWNWFAFPENEHVALCNVCKDTIAVNHVANDAEHVLLAHLQHNHAEIYLDSMVKMDMNKLEDTNQTQTKAVECNSGNNVEVLFVHGDLEFNRVCKLCQTVVQARDGSLEEMLNHVIKDHPEEDLKPPKVKRKKKKLTAIWLYFSKGEDEEERICQICGIIVRGMNSSTSGMLTHLRAYHKTEYSEWQKLRESGSNLNASTKIILDKSKLPKISSQKLMKKRGRKANEAMLANAPEIRTCAECDKVFSCRGAMQYHCRVVHSGVRPFSCDFCGKTFARKDSYDSHITQHNAVKPFMCQHCGKTFGRRHTRDVHERSHIGDRRYTCAYCPKKFMSGQQKIAHERVHTGEKPYQCTNCGKTFAQQHQLVTHFRIHSGEKPYHCPKCGQHFRHLSSHRNHKCSTSTPRQMHHTILVHNSEPIQSDPEEVYREQEEALSAQYRLTVSHAPVPTILKYC